MSINISELIWTVICFFVLLVVLKKLLFDPLVSFMAARDARIQDGLNAGRTAQQQLDAAARVRSEAQRKQAAAADALLAEAKSAAERARAHSITPVAGISSSCQAWTTLVGTRAASSAGIGPMASGGTIRNSARVGTCKDAIAEMYAPRLEPPSPTGPPRATAPAPRSPAQTPLPRPGRGRT